MELLVTDDGVLTWPGGRIPCRLGRAGIRKEKREGDGATPAGVFPLRAVYYRPDRLSAPPATGLPLHPLRPELGWCDAPDAAAYKRLVTLPCTANHERLWREDGLYDLLVVIGYNDDPVRPGLGSAIFLHVADPDGTPTAGCVAMALDDLISLVATCAPADRIRIRRGGSDT